MTTSFELADYNFIAFGVNLHDRKLRIHGDLNFSFRGYSGEVTDQKARISPMLMIKAYKSDCKTKKDVVLLKMDSGKIKFQFQKKSHLYSMR